MKEIKIAGFSTDTSPDDKPAVCVYGLENVGKTKFGCTVPHDDGVIGYLALDKNTKRTVDKYREAWGLPLLINARPFMTDKDSIALATLDSEKPAELKEIKQRYTDVVKRITEAGVALAENKDVESIVLDTGDQFFDMILFSHFGRRNQIESYQRGASNQDMIDFVGAMRTKNFCFICRAAEIWKDTGEVDKQGRKKQAPTDKYKPAGFGKIGGFMTVTCELIARVVGSADAESDDALAKKYRVRVHHCKGNTLLEGQDLHEYGVSGEAITWSNLMTAVGLEG